MKEVLKVFNELIETTLTNSSNNEAVITNVKVWAESWQKEMELAINYSRCCVNKNSEKHPIDVLNETMQVGDEIEEIQFYCRNKDATFDAVCQDQCKLCKHVEYM